MDVIGRAQMSGVVNTIYDDSIVLHVHSKKEFGDALDKFTKISNSIGLAISPSKNKSDGQERRREEHHLQDTWNKSRQCDLLQGPSDIF